MKITLEIPDGIVCAFLNGVEATFGGMNMVSYSLDSDDLHDGAEIKLPRDREEMDNGQDKAV